MEKIGAIVRGRADIEGVVGIEPGPGRREERIQVTEKAAVLQAVEPRPFRFPQAGQEGGIEKETPAEMPDLLHISGIQRGLFHHERDRTPPPDGGQVIPDVHHALPFEALDQHGQDPQRTAERIIHPEGHAHHTLRVQFAPDLPEGFSGQEVLFADGLQTGSAAEGAQGGEQDQVIPGPVHVEKGPGGEVAERDGWIPEEIARFPGQFLPKEGKGDRVRLHHGDPVRAPVDGLRYMDARTRVEEQNTLPCPDGEGKCTGREVQKRLPGLSRPGHDRPEPVPVVEDSLRHRDPSRVREAQTRCVTQGRG